MIFRRYFRPGNIVYDIQRNIAKDILIIKYRLRHLPEYRNRYYTYFNIIWDIILHMDHDIVLDQCKYPQDIGSTEKDTIRYPKDI
jgi:hypothetical protein